MEINALVVIYIYIYIYIEKALAVIYGCVEAMLGKKERSLWNLL